MSYAFDLRQVCGGYAYFSVFTMGMGVSGRDTRRSPSGVHEARFISALAEMGQLTSIVDSRESYRDWLCVQGWAVVDEEYAREYMPQWLGVRKCIRSPLGSYTDVSIASKKILSRSYRGKAREIIIDRDGRQCLRCGVVANLTLQHVLPFSHGGETNSRNMVTLCEPCNQELRDEIDQELYQLAGLAQGVELSLLRGGSFDNNALIRAAYLSANLMHTRCEIW